MSILLVLLSLIFFFLFVDARGRLDYDSRGINCRRFITSGTYINPYDPSRIFTVDTDAYNRVISSVYQNMQKSKRDFVISSNSVRVTSDNAYIDLIFAKATGYKDSAILIYVSDLSKGDCNIYTVFPSVHRCVRRGDTIRIGPFNARQTVGFMVDNTKRRGLGDCIAKNEYNSCAWVKFDEETAIIGFEDGGISSEFARYDADYSDAVIIIKSSKVTFPDGIMTMRGKIIDKCYDVQPMSSVNVGGKSWALLSNPEISCLCGMYIPTGWAISEYSDELVDVSKRYGNRLVLYAIGRDFYWMRNGAFSGKSVDVMVVNGCYYVKCGYSIILIGKKESTRSCGKHYSTEYLGSFISPGRIDIYPGSGQYSFKSVLTIKESFRSSRLDIYVAIDDVFFKLYNRDLERCIGYPGHVYRGCTFTHVFKRGGEIKLLGTRSNAADLISDIRANAPKDRAGWLNGDYIKAFTALFSIDERRANKVLIMLSSMVGINSDSFSIELAEKNVFVVHVVGGYVSNEYGRGYYTCFYSDFYMSDNNLYDILYRSGGYTISSGHVDVSGSAISVSTDVASSWSDFVFYPGIGRFEVYAYRNTRPVARSFEFSLYDDEEVTFSFMDYVSDAEGNKIYICFVPLKLHGELYVGSSVVGGKCQDSAESVYKYVPKYIGTDYKDTFIWAPYDQCLLSNKEETATINVRTRHHRPVANDIEISVLQHEHKEIDFYTNTLNDIGHSDNDFCVRIDVPPKYGVVMKDDKDITNSGKRFCPPYVAMYYPRNAPEGSYSLHYTSSIRKGGQVAYAQGKVSIEVKFNAIGPSIEERERVFVSPGIHGFTVKFTDENNPPSSSFNVRLTVRDDSVEFKCGDSVMNDQGFIRSASCSPAEYIEFTIDVGSGERISVFRVGIDVENSYNKKSSTALYITRIDMDRPKLTVSPQSQEFIQATTECSGTVEFSGEPGNDDFVLEDSYEFSFNFPEGMNHKSYFSKGRDGSESVLKSSENLIIDERGIGVVKFRICPDKESYGNFIITGKYFVGGKYVYDTAVYTLTVECDPIGPFSKNQNLKTNQSDSIIVNVPVSVDRPKDADSLLEFEYLGGDYDGFFSYGSSVVSEKNKEFLVDGKRGTIQFEFHPSIKIFGEITFNYSLRVADYPRKRSGPYSIVIDVSFKNSPPMSRDLDFYTKKNELLRFVIVGEDVDVRDQGELKLEIFDFAPNIDEINGKLCFDADLKDCMSGDGVFSFSNSDKKTFYYMPDRDFFMVGSAAFQFSFKYCDSAKACTGNQTCRVYVNPLNTPPKYIGDTLFNVEQDHEAIFSPSMNIILERKDDSAIVSLVTPPDRGTFRLYVKRKFINSSEIKGYPFEFDSLYYTPRKYDWGDNFTSFTIRTTSEINKNYEELDIGVSVFRTYRPARLLKFEDSIDIDRKSSETFYLNATSYTDLPNELSLSLYSYSHYSTDWGIRKCEKAEDGELKCGGRIISQSVQRARITPSYVVDKGCATIEDLRDKLVAGEFDPLSCHATFIISIELSSTSYGRPYGYLIATPNGYVQGEHYHMKVNVRSLEKGPEIHGPDVIYVRRRDGVTLNDADMKYIEVRDDVSVTQMGKLLVFLEKGTAYIDTKDSPVCGYQDTPGTRGILFNGVGYNTLVCRDYFSNINDILKELVVSFDGKHVVLNFTIGDEADVSKGLGYPLYASMVVELVHSPEKKRINVALIAAMSSAVCLAALAAAVYYIRKTKAPSVDYFDDNGSITSAPQNPLFKPVNSTFSNPVFRGS